MKFAVPQNIDIPEKVLGPFTFPQIIYLIGAGSFTFFLFFLTVPVFITIPIAFIIDVLALLLAFYRPFNQHFIVVLLAFINYLRRDKLFIWKKEEYRETG